MQQYNELLAWLCLLQAEDVVSLYGTPKEEIPPNSASAIKSENGSFNVGAGAGNQA